ncbi:MAG TPA: tetratricopeptide repeat protein [bacterium]|nr:tetratricopeptide repeat protein [bacterium]
MLDKRAADAFKFLEQIAKFFDSSQTKEVNDRILNQLYSEKGYIPNSKIQITPKMVVDIANILEREVVEPDYFDLSDKKIIEIVEQLQKFYKSDRVILNGKFFDNFVEIVDGITYKEYEKDIENQTCDITPLDYYLKGISYAEKGDYEQALQYYLQGYELIKDEKAKEKLLFCQNILILLICLGKASEIYKWEEEFLGLIEYEKSAHEKVKLHIEIGLSGKIQKNYVIAINHFFLAIDTIKKVFLHGLSGINISGMPCIYESDNKYPIDVLETVLYIKCILEILKDIPDIPEIQEKKQKLLSDMSFIILRMEQIVEKQIFEGSDTSKMKNAHIPLNEKEVKEIQNQIQLYEKDIEKNPDDVFAYFQMGLLYNEREMYEEAYNCFEKALEINPENIELLFQKGLALASFKKYQEGLVYINKALEIDPKYILALWGKGATLEEMNKGQEADYYYNMALEIEPENIFILTDKGSNLRQLGRYQEAIDTFNKAIAIDPEFAVCYYEKACAESLDNRKDEALKSLKKAIKLDPSLKENAKNDADFKNICEDRTFKRIVR